LPKQLNLLLIAVPFFLIIPLAMIAYSSEDLGSSYCGAVEKRYGIIGREGGYDRTVGPKVLVIRIEGVISSWSKQYLVRAINLAESRNYPLIVELNTPGGLADVATDMVSEITRSKVPIIGYVVDKWAESAGTMILVSTHIAAMQPGTIIGSLQPVTYNPATGGYAPVNESKILNPIIQTLCEHGASKGRNATALVRFVLYNDNYGAYDAMRYNVVDVVAPTREELIREVNGFIVALYGDERVKLELDGSYEFISLSPSEWVLSVISDPLISGVLLSVGVLALIFSIASANLPGIALGLLFVILGLLGSGLNPNIASIILIALGGLLVFIEINTPGFGIIGGTGILMLVMGIVLLPAIPGPEGFSISGEYLNQIIIYVYALGIGAGALTAFVVYKILQVRKVKPYIWRLEGSIGEAIEDLKPGTPGYVIVEGEYWKAVSDEEIKKGEQVIILGKEDHIVRVKKARKP